MRANVLYRVTSASLSRSLRVYFSALRRIWQEVAWMLITGGRIKSCRYLGHIAWRQLYPGVSKWRLYKKIGWKCFRILGIFSNVIKNEHLQNRDILPTGMVAKEHITDDKYYWRQNFKFNYEKVKYLWKWALIYMF